MRTVAASSTHHRNGTKARLIGERNPMRYGDWPEGIWMEHGSVVTLVEFHPELPPLPGQPDSGVPASYAAEVVPGAQLVLWAEDEGSMWEVTKT